MSNRELEEAGMEGLVGQEKIICPTYEGLVRTLAEAMRVDKVKIAGEPESGFDYEDIRSWIGAVDFAGGKVPDIQANLSSERGKRVTTIEIQKQKAVEGINEKATKEELIYAMALTEAKMKVIAETAEEIYPAVTFQINDLRKEMKRVREEILGNKEKAVSLKDILEAIESNGVITMASLLVITGLFLASCGPVTATETATPMATNTPRVTETMTPPVATETATPTMTATETPTPEASTETVTPENRWGGYKIENANIGFIERVSMVDGNQGLDSGFNLVLLDAGKREINNIFLDANAYNDYQIEAKIVQMEGSQGTAEWPIIIARNLKTGKIYRWAVWALTPGGYSLRLPSEEDLRDVQMLVPLAEVTTLGGPGGGLSAGIDVVGPVVGDGVQPTFRLVQNSGWYFMPPFPDLFGQEPPLKNGGF